ncbi:peptide-methionine (S)-S-oxide reductase MsrA [Membranihabitans marinus]|uniref:peptide-methionine (S)-S-oxide reductase MsrA n=1 Tax=Membranihabitans marinus TaxID=1227546 RepID=UPI001F0316EB|nr:peptide-methionine (S)-S-oxide reductase MsrA [Membranihabitans marinus]
MKLTLFYLLSPIIGLILQCDNGSSSGKMMTNSTQTIVMEGESIATLAGGCFWCTEAIFEKLNGVNRVISGYAGGQTDNPSYETIGTGLTGHAEAIQIYYDSTTIDFPTLLEVFFMAAHDPTQVNRQGPDVGSQYRSIAFYRNITEKDIIDQYIEDLNESGKWNQVIATEVTEFSKFYEAEDYHQDYYPAHPGNPYIQNVTRPKVEKFEKNYKSLLKQQP